MIPDRWAMAHCPGSGSDAEGWRDGCGDCARRTATGSPIEPPPIIVFWCEYYVDPLNPMMRKEPGAGTLLPRVKRTA
jgi:hypothetical protein